MNVLSRYQAIEAGWDVNSVLKVSVSCKTPRFDFNSYVHPFFERVFLPSLTSSHLSPLSHRTFPPKCYIPTNFSSQGQRPHCSAFRCRMGPGDRYRAVASQGLQRGHDRQGWHEQVTTLAQQNLNPKPLENIYS